MILFLICYRNLSEKQLFQEPMGSTDDGWSTRSKFCRVLVNSPTGGTSYDRNTVSSCPHERKEHDRDNFHDNPASTPVQKESVVQMDSPSKNQRKTSLLSIKQDGHYSLASSNCQGVVSPARSNKHVRLALPDITISPVPSAMRLSLVGSLLGGNIHSVYQNHGIHGNRYRRRRAVSTSDYKTCAIVHSKMKLGDLM